MNDHSTNRRQFIKRGAALAIVPLTAGLYSGAASAADQVDLDDPTAKAIGYVHDGSASDKRSDASQTCVNCQLYTGAAGDEWGPCALFPGKAVAAKGWCTAWVLKTG